MIEASAKAHEHSNAEWLYAIDLKVNGETTLLAKIGTPPHGNAAIRTMHVQLDGKELSSKRSTSQRHKQVHVSVHSLSHKTIGRQHAETVHVQIKDGTHSE